MCLGRMYKHVLAPVKKRKTHLVYRLPVRNLRQPSGFDKSQPIYLFIYLFIGLIRMSSLSLLFIYFSPQETQRSQLASQ